MLQLVRRAGLPSPKVNASLEGFTVDFLWRGPRLAVEVDGYEFHNSRRAFDSDHDRDVELGAVGFQVMRFTWEQVTERPERVLALLTQRLTGLAAAQSGRSSGMVS